MRHRKKGRKLGRTSAHRKRTLQALSAALIEHKRITTTIPKAKELRPFIEPLITRAKSDTEHNRRQVFRHLQNKAAIKELFDEIADRVGNRPGGYTRIIKLGSRTGDGAEMAMIELVDYNDVKPAGSSTGRSRTRRGSGKGRREDSDRSDDAAASSDDAASDAEATEPDSVDAPEAEADAAPEASGNAASGEAAPDAETPDAEDDAPSKS